MDTFSFERLTAYEASRQLVAEVYKLMAAFPDDEKYCLAAQLRRAIVSVPSSIAEGCGRCSYKEKIHFVEIAYGSLLESFCQLDIARTLGYIEVDSLDVLRPRFFDVSRLLNALKQSYQKTLNS